MSPSSLARREEFLRFESGAPTPNRAARVVEAGRRVVWRGEGRVAMQVVSLAPLRTEIPVGYWPLAGITLVTEVLARPYERILVYGDDVLQGVLEGGRHGLSPWRRKIDLVRIDTREQQMQVAGQELITADKATLRLNLLLKYAIGDPVAASHTEE